MSERFLKIAVLAASYALCVHCGWPAADDEAVEFAESQQIDNVKNMFVNKEGQLWYCPISMDTTSQQAGQGIPLLQQEIIEELLKNGAIIISKDVESIEEGVFRLQDLKTVIFEEESNLKWIAPGAFMYSLLEQIQIPANVEFIERYAFFNCLELKSIDFTSANKLKRIGEAAFGDCAIESVQIPANVEFIEKYAFARCQKLRSIDFTLANKLKKIDENAFSGCAIEAVQIPANVEFIEKYAFAGCYNLRTVTFAQKSKLKKIEMGTFNSCSSLTQITIPDSVVEIEERAFNECTSLEQITIPDSVTKIDSVAFGICPSLKQLVIPNSVTKIGNGAFMGAIITLSLPISSLSIGEGDIMENITSELARIFAIEPKSVSPIWVGRSSSGSIVTIRNPDGSTHSKWKLNDKKEWDRLEDPEVIVQPDIKE